MTMELPGLAVETAATPTPEPKPEAKATPAPVEEKAPETPAPAPEATPEPAFWSKLPKDVQESLVKANVTGENLVEHFQKVYDKLGRERQALENERKTLGTKEPEKLPATKEAQELKVLKQFLTNKAQKDPSKWEEYEALYKEVVDAAQNINEDDQPLTRAEIKAMLQEEWEARAMNDATLQLVKATKGRLSTEDAFAFINGLTANGLSVEEATQRVLGLTGAVEKAAAEEAAGAITQPKQKTPIVAPGTTSVPPPVNREMTDDELAKEVVRLAMKDAERKA